MANLIIWITAYIFLITNFFSIATFTTAEPLQFCKYSSGNSIDFCMGLTVHENITTNSNDIYLSFVHTRYGGTDRGWTAIGTGNEMAGSLMFIIYGNPLGTEAPIVSIRGSTGHSQPKIIANGISGGLDMRVVRSQWVPSTVSFTPDQPVYEAKVSVVCFSCNLWPGSKIDVQSSAQPWIWAWNEKQAFSVFDYDVELHMHKHHAGGGGWGIFYLDMARSINKARGPPSWPPIRPGVAAVGASENPTGTSELALAVGILMNPAWHLHGFLMGTAFLVLFPLGVIGMRWGSAKSFKYHWILQLTASILTSLGVITGLILSKHITTYHQIQGLAVMCSLILQCIFGWRHHMDYLKIGRRTWISQMHIWLGRLVIVGGWTNLITGLLLRGYPGFCLVIMSVVVGFEFIGVVIFLWLRYMNQRRLNRQVHFCVTEEPNTGKDYFVLTGDDSDEEGITEVDITDEEKRLTKAET